MSRFESFLCKKLKDSHQRYIYMRLMNSQELKAIFKNGVDPEVFLCIVTTFQDMVQGNEEFNNQLEQTFVADFLTALGTQSDDFGIFFSEEELANIKSLIGSLN